MKLVQSVPSLCQSKIKSRQINVCQLKNVSRETGRWCATLIASAAGATGLLQPAGMSKAKVSAASQLPVPLTLLTG